MTRRRLVGDRRLQAGSPSRYGRACRRRSRTSRRRVMPLPIRSRRSTGSPKCRIAWKRECQTSRSEEHTSELQSLAYLVCRLLLEKKKKKLKKQVLYDIKNSVVDIIVHRYRPLI